MNRLIRKAITPWLAADCFSSRDRFQTWLSRRSRCLSNLRRVLIVLAPLPLLAGYVLDRRGIMLLTIAPLLLVLLLSAALDRISAVCDEQNNQEPGRS